MKIYPLAIPFIYDDQGHIKHILIQIQEGGMTIPQLSHVKKSAVPQEVRDQLASAMEVDLNILPRARELSSGDLLDILDICWQYPIMEPYLTWLTNWRGGFSNDPETTIFHVEVWCI